jgi:hypothetical protein
MMSSEAACFATSAAWRCAGINTPTAKPIFCVYPVRKPNSHERIMKGVHGATNTTEVGVAHSHFRGRRDEDASVRPRIGTEHVIPHEQLRVPKRFCSLRIVAHNRRTGPDVGHG